MGADMIAMVRPRENGDDVMEYTSHPIATCCIQVPDREMTCEDQNSRKSLTLSAENLLCSSI